MIAGKHDSNGHVYTWGWEFGLIFKLTTMYWIHKALDLPLWYFLHLFVCASQLRWIRIETMPKDTSKFGRPHIATKHMVGSRLAPSQSATSLQNNAFSHWLGAKPESSLKTEIKLNSLEYDLSMAIPNYVNESCVICMQRVCHFSVQ